jgi:16S rRNA G527 N7-methylase RsmG
VRLAAGRKGTAARHAADGAAPHRPRTHAGFLAHAARRLGLDAYTPLTQNVNELCRSWVFDVDVVTAKAFKPLPEVAPIGAKCILSDARLLVPISEAQVREFALGDEQLARRGDEFVYYSAALTPSRGASQRKQMTCEDARLVR